VLLAAAPPVPWDALLPVELALLAPRPPVPWLAPVLALLVAVPWPPAPWLPLEVPFFDALEHATRPTKRKVPTCDFMADEGIAARARPEDGRGRRGAGAQP